MVFLLRVQERGDTKKIFLAKIKFMVLLWLHTNDVAASEFARFWLLEQAPTPKFTA